MGRDDIGGLEKKVGYEPPSNNNSSCFPGSAQILTPGGYRPIGELEAGDAVMSFNTLTRQLVYRTITRKVSYPPCEIARIEFDNGTVPVLTTTHHTFFTSSGWRRLSKLAVGDRIINERGEAQAISSIKSLSVREPVYNLYTNGEHNFIVDGVVAHNFTVLRPIRVLVHALIFDALMPKQQHDARAVLS